MTGAPPRPVVVLIGGFLAPTPWPHTSSSGAAAASSFPYFPLPADPSTAGVRLIAVSPSGVASLHDRACEIYAQLRGGRVDYGEAHSVEHGHARFGATYARGLFEEWSAQQPVHLVAHSLGGNTARALQQMLSERAFCGGDATCASWVRSITTIASPLNGSFVVNALGAGVADPNNVGLFSAGWCITSLAHFCEWLDSNRLRSAYDFGLQHWGFSRRAPRPPLRDLPSSSALATLARSIAWRSPLGDGRDNAAHDLTVHAAAARNSQSPAAFPDTYYLSFACATDEGVSHSPSENRPSVCARAVDTLVHVAAALLAFSTLLLLPRRASLRRSFSRQTSGESFRGTSMWASLVTFFVALFASIASIFSHSSSAPAATAKHCDPATEPAALFETKFQPCSGLVVASSDLHPTTDASIESPSLAFELCRWVAHRVFLPLLQLKRRWVWRLCHVRHEMPPLPVPGGLDFDAWQRPAGDGLCELHSQTHPHVGRSIVDGRLERVTARALPAALASEFSRIYGSIRQSDAVADASASADADAGNEGTLCSADDAHACLRPGHWYSHQLPCDHLDIVPFPRCLKKQHAFFEALFRVIQSLPSSGLAAPVDCAF